MVCDGSVDCGEKIPNHRWGRIKAVDWTFMRDDRVYCPRHMPDWARKRKEIRDNEASQAQA